MLWVDAMKETVTTVLTMLGTRSSEVAGIGVSGQQHGFVALDGQFNVIRPAKLWCDTSTVAECDLIRAHFGGIAGIVSLVGMDMLPGFTAPKILWMKRNEPENYARLRWVMLPHDFLNFYLTSVPAMEFGDASGMALLDVSKRDWCKEVADFIDPNLINLLPPLQSSRKAVSRICPNLAKEWGLSDQVLVSAGGGDNMMSAIGTANTKAGRVSASLGTSGTVYAFSEKPILDKAGEIAGFCDSTDHWLPLLCVMNVTVATEAVRHTYGWSHDQLEQAVAKVSPGADGLSFLPYLQGERTPNLPGGSGVLHGMNLKNFNSGHIARAVMEGVTLGLGFGIKRLKDLGIQATEVRLTGGGSQSRFWRQLCADVFGCSVVTLASAEGAALGAAIQALSVVQTEKTVEEWAEQLVELKPEETANPNPENVALYQEKLEKHLRLTQVLEAGKFL
jgi:xylulokinase